LAEASGLPVEYADERLTTLAVQRMLAETDMSGAKKRAVTDKLAAALILQTWMDRERGKKRP
jgi:putative holliday junction resolvase